VSGTLDLNDIAQELEFKFDRFSAVFGGPPTHIYSHHHVNMLPQIYPLVAAFALEKTLPQRIDRHEVQQKWLTLDHPPIRSWYNA
ncbi:ChbG/HpnK family deacetylase, partial [Yersinia pestis]|uniref:ChbG/HpnK family deacetylase n=1 Tax=Yersinia pestis TaxID=632 RepID=UPI001C43E377